MTSQLEEHEHWELRIDRDIWIYFIDYLENCTLYSVLSHMWFLKGIVLKF